MDQIRQQTEQIFPAKRLSLFLIIIRHHLKAQTFFPPKDFIFDPYRRIFFPPKDLEFFYTKKASFIWTAKRLRKVLFDSF